MTWDLVRRVRPTAVAVFIAVESKKFHQKLFGLAVLMLTNLINAPKCMPQ